jgi:hypothetical protein
MLTVSLGRIEEHSMGQALHYIAIPPSSSLYARLRSENAFAVIMASLHDYGGGIFKFQSLTDDERAEAIYNLVERESDALGPPGQARRHIDDFFSEVDRLRLAHPGIELRTLYLEGRTDNAIKEQVSRELARAGYVPGLESLFFMDRLLFGDEALTLPSANKPLQVVPAALVAQAAKMLEEIDPFDLFPDNEGQLDDFDDWRQLYLDAAARREAILVAVSP